MIVAKNKNNLFTLSSITADKNVSASNGEPSLTFFSSSEILSLISLAFDSGT